MCISLLSPKKSIRIVYASESVELLKRSGIPVITADLLIQNKSPEALSVLWCIVPQMLFNEDGSLSELPCYCDLTEDLPEERAQYPEDSVYVPTIRSGKPMLDLTVPNPTAPVDDIVYTGTQYGNNSVESLSTVPEERVIMNYAPFGVIEIALTRSIDPDECRWMRLKIWPFSGPRERRTKVNMWYDYITDRLNLHYNVAGPAKVRYEVEQHLAQMRRLVNSSSLAQAASVSVHLANMIETLVDNGINHPDTKVTINDWRTRFFLYPMESFTAIQSDGAVRTVGSQPHFPTQGTRRDAYYEWATGDIQVANPPPQTDQGYFNIRFATKYFPRIYRPLPLYAFLGFMLSIVGLCLYFWGCE